MAGAEIVEGKLHVQVVEQFAEFDQYAAGRLRPLRESRSSIVGWGIWLRSCLTDCDQPRQSRPRRDAYSRIDWGCPGKETPIRTDSLSNISLSAHS